MTQDRMLRVGICSSAGIGRKNWAAIRDSGKAIVTVVASRDVKKAEQFIDECQALKPFSARPRAIAATSEEKKSLYETLYTCDDVDCIYVPIPMLARYDVIFGALRAGKHVVTEKPVADKHEIVAEMIKVAKENNVILVDGTMLTHGKRIQEVSAKIATASPQNEIGEIQSISAVFTFPGGPEFEQNDIRCDPKLEPLAALGDIGSYCIRYAIEGLSRYLAASTPSASIASVIRPLRVKGEHTAKNDRGNNMSFEGKVEFEITTPSVPTKQVVPLHFYCSFREAHAQTISFRGFKGVLTVKDFCLPFLNNKNTEYFIEKHNITNTECRVDHVANYKKYEIEGETSTFQEEQKWDDIGFIMNYMNLRKDVGDEKIAKDLQDKALKMREEFMDLMFVTTQVIAEMYDCANKEIGGWVKVQ